MKKIMFTLAALMLASQFSLAIAADPNTRQAPSRPMAPPRGSTIPQLQLTPDYLYQQITSLKQQNFDLNKQNSSLNQQIQILTGQVNALRSVIQVTQQSTTIQAENLVLSAGQTLTMSSGKETELTVGDNLSLTSGKNLLIKGGQITNVEAEMQVKLKSPFIKLNDGNKSLAVVGSTVSGGKVINGSTSVFAP